VIKNFVVAAFSTILVCSSMAAVAQQNPRPANKIYAQKLVDELFGKRSDLVSMGIHVTPPGQVDNVIIASNIASKVGKKSSEDDMTVMSTGKPLVSMKAEHVYDIVVPMYDASGKTIGIIGMNLRCKGREGEEVALERARQIVEGFKQQTSSTAKLFETVD
jgi:hypothetical protein